MSIAYRAVQWNKHKKIYDALIVGGVLLYLLAFVGIGSIIHSGQSAYDPVTLLIRATGTASFALLHVILAIGPLARMNDRFSPLLYNRRHLGVVTFLIGLLHAALVVFWYGSFGTGIPLINVVAGYSGLDPDAFPYELLGLGALLIMFAMAATSHDFWLANLGPAWWKALHIKVYLAYLLLVGHVALGAVRSETQPVLAIFVGIGIVTLTLLHIAAGARDFRHTKSKVSTDHDWIDAGEAESITDKRARVVELPSGERVAVFRDGASLHAISNVCAHQDGPLGEGAIVDGCVTCPWHGYQYHASDGCSPPPFTEKIPTYELRLQGGRIEINPSARPPGTPTAPVRIGDDIKHEEQP